MPVTCPLCRFNKVSRLLALDTERNCPLANKSLAHSLLRWVTRWVDAESCMSRSPGRSINQIRGTRLQLDWSAAQRGRWLIKSDEPVPTLSLCKSLPLIKGLDGSCSPAHVPVIQAPAQPPPSTVCSPPDLTSPTPRPASPGLRPAGWPLASCVGD